MLNLFIKLVVVLLSQDTQRLAEATRTQAYNYLTPTTAFVHVVAAKMAETPEVPAELLLGMAYVESRYSAAATSRVCDGQRSTGIPTWTTPPSNVSGPYFCGVTQAEAGYSWEKCLGLRNIFVGYATTAVELGKWLKVCHQSIECSLTGYGGGFPAINAGVSTYPARVLSRAARIRRAASGAS